MNNTTEKMDTHNKRSALLFFCHRKVHHRLQDLNSRVRIDVDGRIVRSTVNKNISQEKCKESVICRKRKPDKGKTSLDDEPVR